MIKSYGLRKADTGELSVLSYEVNVCPVCGQTLFVIGVRKRKSIDAEGEAQTLIIRRLRCKGCRAIHHELPDILVPYKRHCADTVEKIVVGNPQGLPCEESTIRRIKSWWEDCRLYFECALTSLREKHGAIFPERPAPREIIRAVVNANLWLHTRSAFLSG
jgi:hypothetical protein